MTDIVFRGALSALKAKIEALATSDTATAEDLAMLGSALERIAGKTSAIEVEMVGDEQRTAVTSAANAARDNALQAIATAVAAANEALVEQIVSINAAGANAIQPITDAEAAALAAIQGEREGGTFTGPVNFKAAIAESSNAVSSTSGTVTIDCSVGNKFVLVLTEDVTGFTFINVPAPGLSYSFVLNVIQDANGSAFAFNWDPSFSWPERTLPTLTTTANARDRFTFETDDGGASWDASPAGFDMGVSA